MEENKFFRLVWRFNGLVISVAGVLAVSVLLFVTYKLFQDVTRDRTTRNIVNIEENSEVKENWRLGQLSKINDEKTLMIPLYSDQLSERAYFSKSSNSARNYLFINTETSEKNWLFNHTNYLIERSERLREGDYNSDKPVIAILYQLVQLDSDQDNRLSATDISTVAVTKPDGSGYKELIKEVEKIVDHTLLNQTELFLIYQKAGISYSTIINLENFEVTKTEKLPKVGL
ncbi:hypothetical protein [Pseudoalteromonas spongiae]|uniref:hypothetical protein n=1 Tax=Pseudoalteromonas spongiae TaxID=298657 RepID=UPI0037364940